MRGRNVTKPFSIAGFILGELYMLYTVLAPQHGGATPFDVVFLASTSAASIAGPFQFFALLTPLYTAAPPVGFQIWAVLSAGLFFGPFGALIGMGLGLLVGAVLPKK